MRRVTVFGLAVGFAVVLAIGCKYQEPQAAAPQPRTAGTYAYPPPPGYYPPQQPPGYYPPQPSPSSYPQPQPAPQPRPQPQPQPQPAPQPQPYNPWLTMIEQLLKGGAPPPSPAPSPAPTIVPPTPPTPPTPTPSISPRALDLANAINRYRSQNGLPPIPISKSLSHVAETHVRDLHDSPKQGPSCNGHSWSSKGPWTPCCYTPDHAQAKCMWQKPAELTALKGTGFEITIGQPGDQNAAIALDSQKAIAAWQGSPLHNDVILNKGTWQSMTWRSMGAGIIDTHACAWFSDQADPAQ